MSSGNVMYCIQVDLLPLKILYDENRSGIVLRLIFFHNQFLIFTYVYNIKIVSMVKIYQPEEETFACIRRYIFYHNL